MPCPLSPLMYAMPPQASELPHYALLTDQGNGKKLVVYVSQDDLEPSRDKLEVGAVNIYHGSRIFRRGT